MGVSLERVQFKFASIVGELCNEPDVLSQFAVWLDLRLAEYKLKGNISLDCSGEEPDPIWLKGLNKGKTGKSRHSSQRSVPPSSPFHSTNPTMVPDSRFSPSHLDSSSFKTSQNRSFQDPVSQGDQCHNPSTHNQSTGNNLPQHNHNQYFQSQTDISPSSPDVVVVKDEGEIVYTAMVHNSDQESGKRKITDRESFAENQWSSPSKQRRFSQPSESPSNQSLMSVISGYQGDSQESDSKGDNSSYILPSTSSMAATDLNTDSFNIGSGTDTSFNTSQNTFTDSSWGNQPEPSTLQNGNVTEAGNLGLRGKGLVSSTTSQHDYSARYQNQSRKHCINTERLAQIPRQTVTSMVAAVGVFERWLWKNAQTEKRSFADIPPEQLNLYLAEFFQKITLPNGKDYKQDSFQCLRSYLSRYLKEVNYPVSLNHNIFQEALAAFQHRRVSLLLNHKHNQNL